MVSDDGARQWSDGVSGRENHGLFTGQGFQSTALDIRIGIETVSDRLGARSHCPTIQSSVVCIANHDAMFLELAEQLAHSVFDSTGLEGIAALGSAQVGKNQDVEFDTGRGMGLKHFVGDFEDSRRSFFVDALFEPFGQA